MKKKISPCLLALSALATALGWAPAARAQVWIRGSTWTDFSNDPVACVASAGEGLPGQACSAVAALPGWEVFADGSGGNPLLQDYGSGPGYGFPGGPGFRFPFQCDGTPSCVPGGGSVCCPTSVQTGGAPGEQYLSMDEAGVLWWVNSQTQHIHYYVPGSRSDVDLDAVTGQTGNQWHTVAAGAPEVSLSTTQLPEGQVWAIDTANNIFALRGYLDSNLNLAFGGWAQMPGSAAQIAFMNETNASTLCGSDWHVPWVLDVWGNIYIYGPSQGCLNGGQWSQVGVGFSLAPNDMMLGGTVAAPVLYQWQQTQFFEALQPPLPPGVEIATIGGRVSMTQVWITDTNHDIWYEKCGFFGCR